MNSSISWVHTEQGRFEREPFRIKNWMIYFTGLQEGAALIGFVRFLLGCRIEWDRRQKFSVPSYYSSPVGPLRNRWERRYSQYNCHHRQLSQLKTSDHVQKTRARVFRESGDRYVREQIWLFLQLHILLHTLCLTNYVSSKTSQPFSF